MHSPPDTALAYQLAALRTEVQLHMIALYMEPYNLSQPIFWADVREAEQRRPSAATLLANAGAPANASFVMLDFSAARNVSKCSWLKTDINLMDLLSRIGGVVPSSLAIFTILVKICAMLADQWCIPFVRRCPPPPDDDDNAGDENGGGGRVGKAPACSPVGDGPMGARRRFEDGGTSSYMAVTNVNMAAALSALPGGGGAMKSGEAVILEQRVDTRQPLIGV